VTTQVRFGLREDNQIAQFCSSRAILRACDDSCPWGFCSLPPWSWWPIRSPARMAVPIQKDKPHLRSVRTMSIYVCGVWELV